MIQLYVKKQDLTIEPDGEDYLVSIENVQANDFVNEFCAEEILDAMDFDTISDYIIARAQDNESEF
jgi:hypothetical protein